MKEFFLGKLTEHALPHEWFTIGGTIGFILLPILALAILARVKGWKWLWGEWLTSVDPKRIGIMYFIVAGFMLIRGGLDALMVWLQQALAPSTAVLGASHGYLSSEHFQQIFTAHGNIMVFFVAMGFVFGLINYIVPLQIGARDLASPFLNTLGFWLYVGGVLMVNLFFGVGGEYAATGWLAVAPLSGIQFSPGVGVDYWIWSLQISGIGTTLAGINFVMTILKMRAPGMTLWKMPMFTWGSLCSMIMVVTVFPLLTATLFLMFFDRYFGMHFFTTNLGGNAMMYTNLIWMWGHPEVYILILPAFGVFSEVVATFSRKSIASYSSQVLAMIGVTVFALSVWLHHFFTMGAGADVNAFFGVMTMVIAIPTSVLVFGWIATMHKGRIKFTLPMLWFLGFVGIFAIGGMAGVVLAVPPADFQLHNSLFLVAHFHSNVIGGVLFGIFAGINYWFPKFAGFRLNERIGRQAFWCWIVGFCLSFIPMYVLGIMGATRRLDHYDASTGWQPFYIMMFIGGLVIATGVALQIVQIIASVIQKRQLVDTTGDPWDGRTMEWATASPPPSYNMAVIPTITTRDAFYEFKKHGGLPKAKYEDIRVPYNTASGIYIAICAFATCFAFVWHINWLAAAGILGVIVCFIARTFNDKIEYTITAKEIEKIEEDRKKADSAKKPIAGEEMSLWEFIKIVVTWALGLVVGLKRRVHGS
ncbi:MAG TPA: cbb3-type cytochrome c oxidase subunit I [Candidatus Saccharimonadales bacterium]|jgi:cytochrome o ubiquinol oxidase subunit 1|nr:cbb3-type cytochrome c oxidase subunit I [Candidatus Saccharimonadales bacterium]